MITPARLWAIQRMEQEELLSEITKVQNKISFKIGGISLIIGLIIGYFIGILI